MNSVIKSLFVTAALLCAAAHADEGMESLKFFKASGMQHGKWQVELLEGGDPQMQQGMQKMGKMSICMDLAKQMGKDYQRDNPQANSCTHKVISDSSSSAEVEVSCESGTHIHSIITRESDKNLLIDSTITSRDSKVRHMKMRYSYQGECTANEGVVQFDKNSPVCKMMQKNTQGKDMAAMCARFQDKMREQCEQNKKNMQASCQQ